METLAFSKRGGVYLPKILKPIKNQNKMKKLIYFAVCCIAALSFSSCSKDYVGSKRNLIGKWELYRAEHHYVKDCNYDGVEHKAGDVVVYDNNTVDEQVYLTFNNGGTMTYELVGEDGTKETGAVSYAFDRDSKKLTVVFESCNVSRLTNSELVLADDYDDSWEGNSWSTYYFRKVK